MSTFTVTYRATVNYYVEVEADNWEQAVSAGFAEELPRIFEAKINTQDWSADMVEQDGELIHVFID